MAAVIRKPIQNVVASASKSEGGLKLLKTWVWSEGVQKVGSAAASAGRVNAREASSLSSTWMMSEGIAKIGQEGAVSARLSHAAQTRSPVSLLQSWMWSNGISRIAAPQTASHAAPSTSSMAYNWIVQSGLARVPAWVAAEEATTRQGATKGSLAFNWMVKEGVTSRFPKKEASRFALPLAATIALAGVTYYAKDMIPTRAQSSALVRRSSVEAQSLKHARFALKFI